MQSHIDVIDQTRDKEAYIVSLGIKSEITKISDLPENISPKPCCKFHDLQLNIEDMFHKLSTGNTESFTNQISKFIV